MTNATDSWSQASRMEHAILDHIKQALRVTLDWKAPSVGMARKLSSVQFTMKSFQRHLQRVMDLEEAEGSLRTVAEKRPHLDDAIRRLQREHVAIRAELAEIVPRLDAVSAADGHAVEEACAALARLLDRVDRHDGEEIRLLQEALLSDLGGEG